MLNYLAEVKPYFLSLQENITQQLLALDKTLEYKEDLWEKEPKGGGGKTRVFQKGSIFEKAGVNFSHVQGESLPKAATLTRPHLHKRPYHAVGVSVVIHPDNPYVPTTHANVRFLIVDSDPITWWFGGGYDLTPYYGFEEDCIHWHQSAKNACDPYGKDIYPTFKKNCDEYFYLKHRQEARGIGGLFFDNLNQPDFETCFALTKSIGTSFMQAYMPIVLKRKEHSYTEHEKKFQLYRRGRYVEFNLLYDRGTLFGLESNGRTESILMSMPPEVIWEYNWQPKENSQELKLYTDFLPAKSWIND